MNYLARFSLPLFSSAMILTFCNADEGDANAPVDTKKAASGEWIQLFNGKDLTGWTPKFRGHDLGVNYKNTFRVKDGILQVAYDKYDKWGEFFGHLFYKDEFSHYILRAEYRFVGDQVEGGPKWAL